MTLILFHPFSACLLSLTGAEFVSLKILLDLKFLHSKLFQWSYLHPQQLLNLIFNIFGRGSRFLLDLFEAQRLPPPNPPPWVPLACAAQGTADGQRGQLWA